MADISRRKVLGWTALAPLAGATAVVAGTTARAAVDGAQTSRAAGNGRQTKSEQARQRIQRLNLPNVPLLTHEGRRVMFYDDLVKGKIVTLNFFYSNCDEICPMVTANLAKVQKLLGADVGKKVSMYSFTLKPEQDDVTAIRNYRELFHAQPGWTFLTGKPADLERIRKGIGFTYPDPAIDKDKTQHIGNVRYGNEPLMLWAACPGMANATYLAESITWMLRPDTNRIQAS
ncbi:MAG: SCO1/SenC family protein [Gammaproteobacteria bacterium]|jgi:protein SCO1/2|nr:SCO1/SenC family protein [Gammaproteobacteria bacterium]